MRSIGVGGFIGAALFVAFGLAALVPGARNVYRAFASRSWPSVSGVVIESATEKSTMRENSRRTSTAYSAKTIVRYEVGGREFSTGTRRFGQIEGSGDISDAVLERYRFPVGAKVQVFHDPARPEVATIYPGFHANALLLPLAGFAFFAAALLVLAVSRGTSGTGAAIITFAFVFCGIGVALLVPGLRNVYLAHGSERWPKAPARIVYGARPYDESLAAADSAGTSSAPSDSLEESPSANRLVYRFETGGNVHFGNTRHFGQVSSSSDDEWTNAILVRYPLGRAVSVAYSPTDPDVSALEPGISKEAWLLPGAGLAFLLFGLAAFRWIVPALSR